MKKALEAYWAGASTRDELAAAASAVEAQAWRDQSAAGIDLIALDGTLYDQVNTRAARLFWRCPVWLRGGGGGGGGGHTTACRRLHSPCCPL